MRAKLILLMFVLSIAACGGGGDSSTPAPTPPTSTTYTASAASQQQTTLTNILLPAGYTNYGILVNGGYTLQASNGQNTINIVLQAIDLNNLCNTSNAITVGFAP